LGYNKNWRPRERYSDDKVTGSGISVVVRNNDFNGALRKFKKKVQEAGIIQEVRRRQEYVKPSEIKRKAKAAGKARWLKKQAKEKFDRGY
tara:strand:+ start:2633 stop:2902 length:270 start_codon:yes stop_codon:yes gene_type:complete